MTRALLFPLALLLGACGPAPPEEPSEPARRLRLFDRMGEALQDSHFDRHFSGVIDIGGSPQYFPDGVPGQTWIAIPEGEGLEFREGGATIEPSGGREGAGLRLGPGLPDRARAIALVPGKGLSRVRLSGRVRLEGNPLAGESSSREVLRVVELAATVTDPRRESVAHRRTWSPTHDVSRRVDPSSWDRFELEFVSDVRTRTLELQLLHRSGGSEAAVTRFDDLAIQFEPLSQTELADYLRERYRPREGAGDAPLRVHIMGEVRDAMSLIPPSTLRIPVELPPADSLPRLRFRYAMAPEAFRTEGDGARIEVRFEPEEGAPVALHALEFDPKNDKQQRGWLEARVDLAPVAGGVGYLVFESSDVGEHDDEDLDPVLIATPRIEPAEEVPSAPNVLLIGVDTLRADHMSVFGYERPTTPNLERLADEGVRFASARSQAPWTLPSFSSILTSLYPSRHGAGRGGHDEWTPIDPSTTSLAEVLARVGYETQGIVANGLISPQYGLDQGFEAYRWAWTFESVDSDVPRVVEFVEGHTNTPWLLFWHIMDPHLPYTTTDEYREGFTDPDYGGRFVGKRGVPFDVLDPRPGRRWYVHEGPPPPPDLSDEDRRFVHDYYDAEIAEMDAAVGRVLAALERSGQWERTIVGFVADHGEGLGDHDHYHHGYTLFDDQVHVPMILRVPGRHAGVVVERPVASIDLAPTILGALGLEPPAFFQGVDRLAADAPTGDAYFIEYPSYDSSAQKAWVEGGFKYLHDPVFHTEALYHVTADPGETRDVAADHPEVVARARAELDAFRWEELQKGRFHLRLRGRAGQRLTLRVTTDDLFDANFAARPAPHEEDFSMDLERENLTLDTQLEDGRLELVFWGRGTTLRLEVALDGVPVALLLGEQLDPRPTPAELARDQIPLLAGSEELEWPEEGRAILWLETGVAEMLPVVLSPEELEVLRELGYAR